VAEARERLKAELGVATHADYRELLGRVDAVSIVTPTAWLLVAGPYLLFTAIRILTRPLRRQA